MHPAQVIALLKIGQTSGAEVARELGVTPTAVYAVIKRKSASRRIANAISSATGKPLSALFGDTYSPRKPSKRRAA